MKTAILLFLTLVALVASQSPPTPCYLPPTFTTEISQYIVLDHGKGVEMNTGILSISFPTTQVRFDVFSGMIMEGGKTIDSYVISVFEDFTSKTATVVDRTTQTCTTEPLNVPMGPGQVPSDATYLGEVYIGSQAIREFGFEISTSPYYFEVGLTTSGCSFANANTFNATVMPPTLVLSEAFWNFTPYVNPYTFEIPCFCSTSMVPLHEMRDEVKQKYEAYRAARNVNKLY